MPSDWFATGAVRLVDHRLLHANLPGDHFIARFLDAHLLGAFKVQAHARWIGAWSDGDVVLQLPLIAVVDDIDSRVDLAVLDARKAADAAPPLTRIIP